MNRNDVLFITQPNTKLMLHGGLDCREEPDSRPIHRQRRRTNTKTRRADSVAMRGTTSPVSSSVLGRPGPVPELSR